MMIKSSAVAYVGTPIFLMIILISAAGAVDADSKAAGTKTTVQKAVEQTAADEKKTHQYKYNPMGKPDPFKPFIEEEMVAVKKLKKYLPLSPLLREDIDQFRLVGISGDEKIRRAIVQDIKGKVYPIHTGTHIGMNNGKVVKILADRIIVEEKLKAPAGKTKTNRITMKLRMDGVEKP